MGSPRPLQVLKTISRGSLSQNDFHNTKRLLAFSTVVDICSDGAKQWWAKLLVTPQESSSGTAWRVLHLRALAVKRATFT